MAWTAGITSWVKGQIMTAAQLNAIGENLNILRTPERGFYSTNYAYTAQLLPTVFGQIGAATITLANCSGKRVLVTATGAFLSVGAGNSFGLCDLLVDGVRVGNATYGLAAFNTGTLAAAENWSVPFTIVYQTGVLSAGSHTFALAGQRTGAIAAYMQGYTSIFAQDF